MIAETQNKEENPLPIITQWRQAVDIVPVRPMQYRLQNDNWVIVEPENISLKQIAEKYFKKLSKYHNFLFTFIV